MWNKINVTLFYVDCLVMCCLGVCGLFNTAKWPITKQCSTATVQRRWDWGNGRADLLKKWRAEGESYYNGR